MQQIKLTNAELYRGDCLEAMKEMADNSIDSIVTDPPYGLSFMGKRWDYDVPSVEIWAECLRVLKPGGHLLAFAGTRTQHRMAVRIEDAGFEIRDMIAWVYGSGFPKSLDVSKAIDKAAGAEREVLGPNPNSLPNMVRVDAAVLSPRVDAPITAPATDAARKWNGWGTALKPAIEPITVARKPLIGTVAENVLTHGTGAINVDGCRVGDEAVISSGSTGMDARRFTQGTRPRDYQARQPAAEHVGRWPANLIHDGSDEVVQLFPANAGGGYGVRGSRSSEHLKGIKATYEVVGFGDSGSAARFFYCAKASKKDRGADNNHPTVKPTDLMRYLCRLVTPPGGVVLDPFMGSGSTGKAAAREGFAFVGIERDPEYFEIAKGRIEHEATMFASVEKTSEKQLRLW